MKTSTFLKTILLGGLFAGIVTSWYIAYANAAGPPAGNTAAPSETTCGQSSCHNVKVSNHTPGRIAIVGTSTKGANMTAGFSAKDTFHMVLSYPHSYKGKTNLYGFQVTCLNKGTGVKFKPAQYGILSLTDKVNTKMVSTSVGGSPRTYVEHTSSGNASAVYKSWKFDWIAPGVIKDTLIFYVCMNAANGDGKNSGDTIYSDTFMFMPKVATKVSASFNYSPTSVCKGSKVTFKDASTGSPIHWDWTFKDGGTTATDTNQNPSYTFTNSGTDSAILTVKDGSGNKSTYSVGILVNGPPVATINSAASSVCSKGDSVLLYASTGSGYTYKWSNGVKGDSLYVKDSSLSYTVTVTNSSGCFAVSAPFKLTINPPLAGPSISSSSTAICSGTSVTLTAGSGFSYYTFMDSNGTLLGPKSSSNILKTTLGGGMHKVSVVGINSAGCTSLASKGLTINVTSAPSMTLTNSGGSGLLGAYCGSDNVTLTAGPSLLAKYKFYQNSTLLQSGSNSTYTFAASTIKKGDKFTVVGANATGCSDSTTGLSLIYSPDLTPGFGYTDLKGNVTFSDSTVGKPVKYSWDFGDKSKIDTNQNPKHAYVAGSYTVTLTVANASGCTYKATKTLNIVVTAIETTVSINYATVYPNPVKEKLNVAINSAEEQKAELTLIDMRGRTVAKQKVMLSSGDNFIIFEMQNVKAGSYILRLNGSKEEVRSFGVTKID